MIYIIDDDKSVRKGFEVLFKSAGLESTSYASAEEFITVMKDIENDRITLVTSRDLNLPDQLLQCYFYSIIYGFLASITLGSVYF